MFRTHLIPALIALGMAVALGSCSDDDDTGATLGTLNFYGMSYTIGSAVMWQGNAYSSQSTAPYTWSDTYTAADGTTVTDRIEGFTTGEGGTAMGNFTLSLYENGLTYNEELSAAKGEGAVMSIQLCSQSTAEPTPGTYTYSDSRTPGTFVAYCSSDYQTTKSIKAAAITDGQLQIDRGADGQYSIAFKGTTSFGGKVEASYNGPVAACRIAQQQSLEYTDVSLAGLLDTTTTRVYYGAVLLGEETGADMGNTDYGTGQAFFSLTTGLTQNASAKRKELADIALGWNAADSTFEFVSPIAMRARLWHDAACVYPCHTRYMMAPASFTDTDYEQLDAASFGYTIDEQQVKIAVDAGSENNFATRYVMFETGHGVKGVMRVRQYIPQQEGTYDYYGIMTYQYTMNPRLVMDIKCPATVSNPEIR